jgi:hypothetical protein
LGQEFALEPQKQVLKKWAVERREYLIDTPAIEDG